MNEKLEAFKHWIKGKRTALVGMGVSNRAAVDFLLACDAVVTARDKSSHPDEETREFLTSRGIRMIYGENYLSELDEQVIFKSPGIRFDVPELLAAKERGAVITSEMEVFCALCPCRIFAVTGSDGKTTTTTIIAKMLEKTAERNGVRVFLGGNIGTPLLPVIEEIGENDFAVLELSSFQLHTMSFSPAVAVITNITPNHLNWHISMEEYIESKKNICRTQQAGGRLVLNAENELTRRIADETLSEVTLFSSKCAITHRNACYYRDGAVWYYDGEEHFVMQRQDIKIVGMHNVENYMAAISAVWEFVDPDDMRDVAKNFGGVRHRIELAAEKGGVKFYNSSIDTSPTRTLAALSSFEEKLIVIVGGYDKHIPIEPLLSPLAGKAKFVVATGATGMQVLTALFAYGYPRESAAYIGSFDDAVKYAAGAAHAGDTVLLSPAAASFDVFPNFERRGDRFCELVSEL